MNGFGKHIKKRQTADHYLSKSRSLGLSAHQLLTHRSVLDALLATPLPKGILRECRSFVMMAVKRVSNVTLAVMDKLLLPIDSFSGGIKGLLPCVQLLF